MCSGFIILVSVFIINISVGKGLAETAVVHVKRACCPAVCPLLLDAQMLKVSEFGVVNYLFWLSCHGSKNLFRPCRQFTHPGPACIVDGIDNCRMGTCQWQLADA